MSVFRSLKSVDREGSRRMGLPSQTTGAVTESGGQEGDPVLSPYPLPSDRVTLFFSQFPCLSHCPSRTTLSWGREGGAKTLFVCGFLQTSPPTPTVVGEDIITITLVQMRIKVKRVQRREVGAHRVL